MSKMKLKRAASWSVPRSKNSWPTHRSPLCDLVASFQYTVIEELLRRTVTAAEQVNAESVIVAGGVACNTGLRAAAQDRAGLRYFFPSPNLSTDNAAMIAAAALSQVRQHHDFAVSISASKPDLSLAV